jgi:hypothetical protein
METVRVMIALQTSMLQQHALSRMIYRCDLRAPDARMGFNWQ